MSALPIELPALPINIKEINILTTDEQKDVKLIFLELQGHQLQIKNFESLIKLVVKAGQELEKKILAARNLDVAIYTVDFSTGQIIKRSEAPNYGPAN